MHGVSEDHDGGGDSAGEGAAELGHGVGGRVQGEEFPDADADDAGEELTEHGVAGLRKGGFDDGEFEDGGGALDWVSDIAIIQDGNGKRLRGRTKLATMTGAL